VAKIVPKLPESTAAEALVLEDLKREARMAVRSIESLAGATEKIERAMPTLIRHLAKDYPDDVLFDIGFALRTKLARPCWGELKRLYLETSRAVVRDRLAAILAEIALSRNVEEMQELLGDVRLGPSRVMLVPATRRIGNRKTAGLGDGAIVRFSDDPELTVAVKQALRGSSR
jgi:hypothetical protein